MPSLRGWGHGPLRRHALLLPRAGPGFQAVLAPALLAGRNTAGEPEAQVAAADARREPDADRRPATPGAVAPAAAPEHTVRALRVEEIPAPLPDVALHVEQPPVIRPQRPHRVGAVQGILGIPGVPAQHVVRVGHRPARDAPGAAGVLPLGLRRQPIPRPPPPVGRLLHPVGVLALLIRQVAPLVPANPFLLTQPVAV